MSVPQNLKPLAGKWSAENRLWLDPGSPAAVSTASADVSYTGQGKFFKLHYTWAYEGEPQEGLLLVSQQPDKVIKATWLDSWHNQDAFMACAGHLTAAGGITVLGSYPAPPGPDWGWRLTIEPGLDDRFALVMHNITPGGEEFLAVEAVFNREDEGE